MNDLSREIQAILDKQIKQGDLDVIDIVPIPMSGDRMVRLRTLEEALDDFSHPESSEAVGYLIQVKPRRTGATAAGTAGSMSVHDAAAMAALGPQALQEEKEEPVLQ